MMFKTRGGVKGFLNNVQKNCGSGEGGHPLSHLTANIKQLSPLNPHLVYFDERSLKNWLQCGSNQMGWTLGTHI